MEKPLWQRQNGTSTKTWYFLFNETSNNIPWWYKLAIRSHDKQFGHVSLMAPAGDGMFQLINPTPCGAELTISPILECLGYDDIGLILKSQGFKVIRYSFEQESSISIYNMPPTCVSLCKAIVGLKSNTITPFGLYKDLLERGGVLL